MESFDEQIAGNVESPRAFAANELVPCPSCARANPPTRANCLYCGSAVGSAVQQPSPGAEPDAHEPERQTAFHVIGLGSDRDENRLSSAAGFLNLEPSDVAALFRARIAPLASVSSVAQGQVMSTQLKSIGIESKVVSDAELNIETPSKPISAMTFDDGAMTVSVRRTGETASIHWGDIALVVLGRLHFTTREVEHKQNQSKQVLDERHVSSDEAVLDVYPHGDRGGFRIQASSFDFSCLDSQKGMTAFENFRSLVALLRRKAVRATFDDDFARLRVALNKVWPCEVQDKTSERRRRLTREVRATATTTDNEIQFTRYSRLLHFFQKLEPGNDARQP